MNFFKKFLKNDKIVSWESDISFVSKYKKYGEVVIKKYKPDSECVKWLNNHLKSFYPYSTIMPIAQHEFRGLEILYENGLSPKPLEIGEDYIIIEKYGFEIKNANKNLYNQAKNILEALENLKFKHNDLLMRNILINKENKLKLIDLTLSEFNNIEIIKYLPVKNWAYPGDERILTYFK